MGSTLRESTKTNRFFTWQGVTVIACLLGMGLHWVFQLTHLSAPGPLAVADYPLIMVMALGGIPLMVGILRNVARGNFGVDLLAVLSFMTAAILGEYLAGVLILLMVSGGQSLEQYALTKASSVLFTLAKRLPYIAHRKMGNHLEDIPLESINIGDLIVIYPHEVSPVDGTVVEGHSSMDEAFLTGEPYQISKAPGTTVLSGAMNGEAVLIIRADKRCVDSRYAKIMAVMEDAEQKRPNIRRLGDQIGSIFTPIALALALLAWYFTGDAVRFLAVLVIATPCPLLIAIPITVISAISLAAERGIIIKNPTVLERLPTCKTAIFDKTGTLTYGQPELTDIYPGPGMDRDQILAFAASLERYSKHPLASALIKAAEKGKLFLPEASEVSEPPGQGLVGLVDNHRIQITHRKKILSTPQKFKGMADLLPPLATGLECIVLLDGKYGGTFHFRDMPRGEGKSFIGHLGSIHKFSKVMLVSGDRETEVKYLADLLGIRETLSQQSPEQKLEIVRREVAAAPTLFMGDGVNDAPAITAATVGLAFGEPTDATAEAASAVFMESSLERVDELLHLSISMRRVALQSAIGGMALSLLGMGFAALGYIPPVMGALLQEGIDVLAIFNALRLIWKRSLESDIPK